MAFNIFRPLSNQEKQDMVELGGTDLLNLFLKELANKKAEYQKKYRPFDYYSARIDFDEKIRSKMGELHTSLDVGKVNTKIEFGDLDKYGDSSRFNFVKVKDHQVTKLVAGIKQEVVIGKTFHFVGKEKGNRISIFVPNDEVENMQRWVDETYSEKPKKAVVEEKPKKEDK